MDKPVKIVIVGNGFGGTYVLKYLDKIYKNHKNIEITLIGEKNYFLFTPLLHEVATGGINRENIVESIHKVVGRCLSSFYLGRAEMVDLENRTVKVGNFNLAYDYLVLAPGAETNYYGIPGAAEYTYPLKSIEDAIRIKNHVIDKIEQASHEPVCAKRKQMLSFAVVGGGPTGVELVSELHELLIDTFSKYYSKEIIDDISVTLIQKIPELVPQFSKKIRGKSLAVLRKKGIHVLLDTEVKEVEKGNLVLDSGEKLHTETVIWVAGIKPVEIQFTGEVAKSKDGRLLVGQYLELIGHPEIFALGDGASFAPNPNTAPLPALAQVAQKQAKSVAENIKRMIAGKPLRSFYYKATGTLMSLGQWMAVGEIMGINISGRLTWWIWRTVYLSKLISWRKKVRVAIDWTLHLVSARDISQL
jgi:NADH dehydrogenase